MINASDIELARCVRIEDELQRRGIKLKRQGTELVGPCPICGGNDRFSINTKKQCWHCRKCDAGDDVGADTIGLVRHLDGCDFVTAINTLTGNGVGIKTTPPPKPTKRNDTNDDQAKASTAGWLWSQRKPITEGTPPWLYLRKRKYIGPIPATLGYLPPLGPYPAAMIAAFGMAAELDEPTVISVPKTVTGVHLTRLTADGDKAPNADGKAKIMRGLCKGAPITVSPPNDLLGIALTEGIEDALSAYQATGLGLWAAGSGSFMPVLAPLIPDYIEAVTIYAHDDTPGALMQLISLAPSRLGASKCSCRGFDPWRSKKTLMMSYAKKAKTPRAHFTTAPNTLTRAIRNSRTAKTTDQKTTGQKTTGHMRTALSTTSKQRSQALALRHSKWPRSRGFGPIGSPQGSSQLLRDCRMRGKDNYSPTWRLRLLEGARGHAMRAEPRKAR
jgi:hypothetical protein